MSSLLVVVDAAAPGLSELLLHARRVVCSKAASFEPGMLAMTAFGSTTTRNRLSEAGMAGYQGVHTLFELAPCCTAALDGLDALQALEGVKSDIFDALVAAVYELHCKDNDGQRRREILVLCDAQRHADDDAFEEDTAQLLKGIDDLGITISVVSPSPLPASGVLHTLFTSLGGGRFEFVRLEGAGLHAQAGGRGLEQVERKGVEARLVAEREVKKEAEPEEAKPDAREEEAGGALVDSNDDDVSVTSEVKLKRQPMRLYLHLGASADKPIDLDADDGAAWDLQRRLTVDLTSEAIDFARLDKERNARHEAAQAAAGGEAVDVDTIDLLEGLRDKLAEHVRRNGLAATACSEFPLVRLSLPWEAERLKRQQRESLLPIWSNPKSAPGQPLYERFVAAWQRAPNQQILLVFHGTPEENIAAICTDGLDPNRRSGQALGPGEYFGEQMAISQGYCRGGRHMLIFAVLLDPSGITFRGNACIVINKAENQLPLAVVTMSGEGYDPSQSYHAAVSNPHPHVERRVDPTDPGGGAFTRAEFIDFYGGTDEWDSALCEKTVDLARRTLRAHLAWSQLDKERKILRTLAKNSADKGVREAMAAQFAHLASTATAMESKKGGDDGCDDEGDEGDEGGEGDAFADWNLRPGVGAPATGLLPKGAAFMVTGALAPADHAKARAHAAVAHAAAAAAQKANAAARVEEFKVGIAETEGAESEEEEEEARVGMDEESAEEEPAKEVVLKPAELVAAEEADEEADAPEMTVAAEAAAAAAVTAAPAAAVAAEATAAPKVPFGEADEFTLADATAEVPQWARHLTLEEASAIASESRPPKRIALAPPGDAAAGSIAAIDETGLSRLLDHELPFARILLFLSPEEATLLATGTCRGIRQHSAPLYNRYCRVFVRRLEAEARQRQRMAGNSRLVPPDALSRAHFPMDEVWAEVCARGRSGLDCLRLLLLTSDGLPDDH